MTDAPLTPRQQLLAALAIGALALSGSIGAMQAGRAQCPTPGGVAVGPARFEPLPEPIGYPAPDLRPHDGR